MAITAALKIQLFANDVLVAESDDPVLWRNVLSAIQKPLSLGQTSTKEDLLGVDDTTKRQNTRKDRGAALDNFATELGLPADEVVGACDPSTEAPYLRLDARYWEALRSKTGSRGPKAVSPLGLSGTLLGLWFRHAGISGNPTVNQAQDVLDTIQLRDHNPTRSLGNTSWLQNRNGSIVINPAQWSQAVKLAKAYCSKQSPDEVS